MLLSRIAGIREAMIPGFMTAAQVQRLLGLPVLAVVPRLKRRASAYDETLKDPMGLFTEAIRAFRLQWVEGHGPGKAPIVLITSRARCRPRVRPACAPRWRPWAARQNVLLIDADLRRRGLSRQFTFDDGPGLTEMLRTRDWEFLLAERGSNNLDVMPTGTRTESPSDLLAEQSLRDYLREAKA